MSENFLIDAYQIHVISRWVRILEVATSSAQHVNVSTYLLEGI